MLETSALAQTSTTSTSRLANIARSAWLALALTTACTRSSAPASNTPSSASPPPALSEGTARTVIRVSDSMTIPQLLDAIGGDSDAVCVFVHAPGSSGTSDAPVLIETESHRVEGQAACGEGLRPFTEALAGRMPVIFELLQAAPPEGEMFGGALLAVQLHFGPRGRLNNGPSIMGGSRLLAAGWVEERTHDEYPVALVALPPAELPEPDPLLALIDDALDDVREPMYDTAIVAALPAITPALAECARRGAATVHFDITGDGEIDNATVLVTDMTPEGEACVVTAVERLRLEIPSGSAPSRAYLPVAIGE